MADTERLHPIFRARLEGLLAATGCRVRSGWRSSEEQAQLYHCYLTGSCNNGNPANPPGSSNHEAAPFGEPAGLAADLEGDLAAAHVATPTTPSASRPPATWKRVTVVAVAGPKTPSTSVVKPWTSSRCWHSTTA